MFDPFYPFDWLATQIVSGLMGISVKSPLGSSLHFFFYDVPKVLTLLAVISFVIGTLQSFMSPEKVRHFLEGKRTFAGNIMAAMLGAITPFCSCSAVPLFIGFLRAGVPLGVTFSYLISAPMVDAVAIFLLWSLFGLQATLIYVGFGVSLAILAGFIIGNFKLEKWVEPSIIKMQQLCQTGEVETEDESFSPVISWKERISEAQFQTTEILKSVWLYVVIGIAIGAGIHGYAPTELITQWAGRDNPFAVLIATLIGVPLYTNVAGVLPIAEALVNKGMPLGTVLSFTMAVTALSLPQMIILKRVLLPQLLFIFIGLTTVGIITVGYIFNTLLLY
ncbi:MULTISPECIES: permease [Pseudanabaena]|uniref:permease n=1 Tax=Pseudanabaena TaxID=1152 RepID=UPI00247A1375|nr:MULTISPECIES: permease [Pseudanabaena]MEA5489091.1 permease [Pseudanabaena sp. CCNP1317]WGS71744.1 permease [Pseudanabaena galeata CCNP1313]